MATPLGEQPESGLRATDRRPRHTLLLSFINNISVYTVILTEKFSVPGLFLSPLSVPLSVYEDKYEPLEGAAPTLPGGALTATAAAGQGRAMNSRDPSPMQLALDQARDAGRRDEVPVGAVIVDGRTGQVVAAAGNRVEELKDPSAHAEILVLREAAAAAAVPRLDGMDLYVTLEPCAMCAAAISLARVRKLVFAAYDPKMGGVEHGVRVFDHPTCHHRPEVIGGVGESEAAALLKQFFKEKR
jgi:tRNA(adenine34) deaminase